MVVRLRVTARTLPSARSANVIGEVPGSGDGIVLLAAHLDSWDLGTGAIDDGAGVGVVLAAAHLIAQHGDKLERTLRVVLYANEEYGLSGAKAYASAHADEIPRHVLGMESDFGAGRVWRLDIRSADSAQPAIDAMLTVLAPLGVERGGKDAHGGADLEPLRNAGMPVLDLQQDGTHYFDYHHTADDTLDKIDRERLRPGGRSLHRDRLHRRGGERRFRAPAACRRREPLRRRHGRGSACERIQRIRARAGAGRHVPPPPGCAGLAVEQPVQVPSEAVAAVPSASSSAA